MNGVRVPALVRLSKQLRALRAVPARPCSLAACSLKKTRNAACKSLHFIQVGGKWEMLRWEESWCGWVLFLFISELNKGVGECGWEIEEARVNRMKEMEILCGISGFNLVLYFCCVSSTGLFVTPSCKKMQSLLGRLSMKTAFMSIIQNAFSTNWFWLRIL